MIERYLVKILNNSFVAGSPMFANGGMGGTGVNGIKGMGTDYLPPPIMSEV